MVKEKMEFLDLPSFTCLYWYVVNITVYSCLEYVMVNYSKTVQELVDRVVETVQPLRIILFGSCARMEADAQSDIDLLVVMPDGTHRRQTSQRLYRQIRGIGVPFDILVATPRDLEIHKDNVGLIYRKVLQEGVEVYAC